jgi:hypothetical protein
VRDLPNNKDWNEDLKSVEAQQQRQAEIARQRESERGLGM